MEKHKGRNAAVVVLLRYGNDYCRSNSRRSFRTFFIGACAKRNSGFIADTRKSVFGTTGYLGFCAQPSALSDDCRTSDGCIFEYTAVFLLFYPITGTLDSALPTAVQGSAFFFAHAGCKFAVALPTLQNIVFVLPQADGKTC